MLKSVSSAVLLIKGSLLQNGFCTNSSDFEAKRCSPKNAPKKVRKTHRKTHRKTECFHRFFSPNFSPSFRVFFCSKNSKCHRKTASKKFSQKIHHGTEQNPECRCGRDGSLSTCPFKKQKLSRKTEHFFSSQFCTSLPSNFLASLPLAFQRGHSLRGRKSPAKTASVVPVVHASLPCGAGSSINAPH